MTVPYYDGIFVGPTSAGGAGSVTGAADSVSIGLASNWKDLAGSSWLVNASNQLVGTFGSNLGTYWLIRPFSEALLEQSADVYFTYDGNGNILGVQLRCAANGLSGYWCMLGTGPTGSLRGNNLQIQVMPYADLSGGNYSHGTGFTYTIGHNYRANFRASGSNPTTLTVTVFDLTASIQAFQQTITDSTAGPQQSAGTIAFTGWVSIGTPMYVNRVVLNNEGSGALTPGTTSTSSVTTTTLTVSSTAPTGGTGSGITYAFQQAPDNGFGAPGAWATIRAAAGSNTFNVTTGLTPGNTYWLRTIYGDSGSNAATSTAVSVTMNSTNPVLGALSIAANDPTGITIRRPVATGGTGTITYGLYCFATAPFTPPGQGRFVGAMPSTTLKDTAPGSGEVQYRALATDSLGNPGLSIQNSSQTSLPARLAESLRVILPIGDSITNFGGGVDLEADMNQLDPLHPCISQTTVPALNQGVIGSKTGDWLPGGTNDLAAQAAVTTALGLGYVVTGVSIMLGANNAKAGAGQSTQSQYLSDMTTIANTWAGRGMRVYLQQPLYIIPPGPGGLWDETSNTAIQAYGAALRSIANGTTIVLGSTTAYDTWRLNPALSADGVHPSSTGNSVLSMLWASGIVMAEDGSGGSVVTIASPSSAIMSNSYFFIG